MSDKTLDIKDLQTNVSGDVLVAGDAGYEAASTTFMVKGSPAVVVLPLSAEDVARSIAFARDNNLTISVRSGGHDNAGHSTNNGGLVINLTRMNDVELIDESQHTVRIGGGAIWGDIANKLHEYGLAISSGDTRTVGVGGLTLAGGVGWMVRKYGLALDSLVAAEVVTADGAILRASKDENSDLFWAVRGGGGNFGVVTSFEFTAHPCKKVYAGSVSYGFESLGEVLRGWRDYMRTAPEELTTMVVAMPTIEAFGNQPPTVIVLCCYAGDDKIAAMNAIDPLLHLAEPTSQDIAEKDYADVLEDAHSPQGLKIIVRNAFFPEFTDEIIDTIVDNGSQVLQIRSVGGAMNRVPADATAFAHRSSEAFIVSPLILPSDASDDAVAKGLEPWHRLATFAKGAYVNFFSESSDEAIRASYPPETYQRLAGIKKKYDPQNIFNQNYNIHPDA